MMWYALDNIACYLYYLYYKLFATAACLYIKINSVPIRPLESWGK